MSTTKLAFIQPAITATATATAPAPAPAPFDAGEIGGKLETRIITTTTQQCVDEEEEEEEEEEELEDGSKQQQKQQQQQPWDMVNSIIRFRNADHQFWWDRTGRMLARLVEAAGYSAAEQYRELFFYALWVAPELGPAPDEHGGVRRWRSPGTPDSTPIDFSWEWGLDGTAVVRYSFEPIGAHAGTARDPLNRRATESWIARLRRHGLVPGLDTEWYRHFARALLLPDDAARARTAEGFVEETTPRAGTVVALDLEKAGPVMKVYIYPGLRAAELGVPSLDVVARALRGLPAAQYRSLDVEPLLAYLREGTRRWGFETGILSLDLVDPGDARVKLYVRAPHTSLEYLTDALTLGGRRDLAAACGPRALEDLRDFWRAFLAGAPARLPPDAPGRASPGFYYTVRAGKPVSAKMYISPFYFCDSDADVLGRLRRFFATRRPGSVDMTDQMDGYERAMESIFGRETLEARCGSSYYVGCALQKDQLRVVTYLSPQTFDCEKDMLRRAEGRK